MNTMKVQERRIENSNNKRKKLRTLRLLSNVNDYDTGEYHSPKNNTDNNYDSNNSYGLPVPNNLSYRFALTQKGKSYLDFQRK
jgi:hypothetical protein